MLLLLAVWGGKRERHAPFILFTAAAAFKIYLPPQHMHRRGFPGGTGRLPDGRAHGHATHKPVVGALYFLLLLKES